MSQSTIKKDFKKPNNNRCKSVILSNQNLITKDNIPIKTRFETSSHIYPMELSLALNIQKNLVVNKNLSDIHVVVTNQPTQIIDYIKNNAATMFDQNDNFSSRYYINSERAKVEKNRNGKGFKQQLFFQTFKNGIETAKIVKKQTEKNEENKKDTLETNLNLANQRISIEQQKRQMADAEILNKHKCKVRSIYTQLKEVASHIVNQDGEQKFSRLEEQIKKKEDINFELMKKTNDKLERRCDIQKVTELQEIKRILLSKKTDAYLLDKENQMTFEEQDETEQGIIDQGDDARSVCSDNSDKTSNVSFVVKGEKQFSDEKYLSKYYDLIALQQKWHGMNKEDVLARVKMMIVREILSKQARIKVSELRKQQQIEARAKAKGIKIKKDLIKTAK